MRKHWLLSAAFLLLLAIPAVAQRITASIRGAVTDQTGAVMAGAKVTVKNEGTGVGQSAVTNSDGNYSFSELPVGSYRVEVESAGFKSEARSKIVLNVADVREIDVQLQTGQITEVVEVEVAAVAVKTVGAEIAGLVTGEQARELPLNGRNFLQLTLLQPGVTAQQGLDTKAKGLSGGSDVSISGGQTTGNLWLVDGADNVDHGSGRTILVYPSVDAIEEFKVQRNNYGAEFGGAGGGQINLVTRGGSNEFHGSGYYYARRDKWNEADFFLKQQGQDAAPLHWDDFGATLGGPILKDKLHFFFSFEQNKDKRTETRVSQVPSAAERAGDFSGTRPECADPLPVDPLTGQAFPGNIIPANRIDPGGALMMQLFSLPNATPSGGSCANYVQAVPTPVDWKQWHGRLDYALNNSTRLMVRYTQDSWVASNANANLWGDDPFPVVGSNWNQPGKSLVVQLNKNIGSSMVNGLTFSYSANTIDVTRGGDNPELVQQLTAAIPTLYPADIKQQGGQGQPAALWGSLGPYSDGTLWNQAPWKNNQDLYVLKDDFSAVFGKHFVKAGFLFSTNKKNEEPANTSLESVGVNNLAGFVGPNGYQAGETTNNTIANWLLSGMVWNTAEIRTNKPVMQRWKDLEFYVADSYKIKPHVTADYGVRLSHFTQPYEAEDNIASFDPASVSAAAGNSPCNGLLFPPGTNPCTPLGLAGGAEGPNRSLVPTKFLLIAPRIGVAWDVHGDGKLAVRGGVGLFYGRERLSAGLGLGTNPPFAGTANVTRTLASAAPVVGEAASSFGAPGSGLAQRAANPHTWQWNLGAQKELVRNTVLEVAYVGSWGKDLSGNRNANEVAPANRLAFAQTGDASLRPLNGVAGLGAGSNMVIWEANRRSIYHSLQAGVVTRFGRGSLASASYTFAKSIGDTGLSNSDSGISTALTYTDSTQPQLDRSRGNNDRRHVFTGTFVLALPTFDDKGGFQKHVLGNWEATSIVQAGTGYPITVFVSTPDGLDGNAGLAGTGYAGNQRPNRTGEPCRASGASETQWLNPAAFSINGYNIGTNGTTGRNVCDGPSFFQWDAALYKNIKLTQRVKLQLRAEFFNVLNTVNFLGFVSGDQTTTWTPQNPVYNTGDPHTATQVISAEPAAGFGQLTEVADPRTIQFGVRLSF